MGKKSFHCFLSTRLNNVFSRHSYYNYSPSALCVPIRARDGYDYFTCAPRTIIICKAISTVTKNNMIYYHDNERREKINGQTRTSFASISIAYRQRVSVQYCTTRNRFIFHTTLRYDLHGIFF